MKNIIQLMDTSARPYLLKVLCSVAVVAIGEFLWLLSAYGGTGNVLLDGNGQTYRFSNQAYGIVYADFQYIVWGGMLISYALLTYWHIKRNRRFCGLGGLTRIKLLPISTRKFLWSEILFVFSCIGYVVLSQCIIVYAVLWLKTDAGIYITNSIFLNFMDVDFTSWLPTAFDELVQLLSFMIFAAYIHVLIGLSCAEASKAYQKGALLFLLALLIFGVLWNAVGYASYESGKSQAIAYSLLLLAACFLIHRYLLRRLAIAGRRRSV